MTRALILISLGVVCLCIAALLMYLQLPRENRPPPAWMRTESGEMTVSLGWFTLLVVGIALIIKGVP